MYGRRMISGRQALGVEYDLRDELYSHFLRLSFGFYDRSQTGQLMSRATIDLQAVRFFLGYGLIFFAQHVVTIVVVTAVLFVYSWKLAFIALAITPIIAGVAYRYSRVSQPVLRDVQQKLAEVSIVAEESITGVHVVKSFAQEARREQHFGDAADRVFEQTLAANRQRALYVPLLTFMPLVAQALVLLAAGRMVVSGSLSLGAFFTFNLLLAMLVMPLRMLGMWVGQAQRAIAAGKRIFEILDEPEEVSDRPDAAPARAGAGSRRVRGCVVRLRPGAARPGGRHSRHPGRTDDRAHRADRIGQDDARGARPPVLRRDFRACRRRRRRRPRRRATLVAARDRRHRAGPVPLLRVDPRQHRARDARRAARGRRGGRPCGGSPRLHPRAPARLRDGRRRARDHAVRRSAPADRHRPSAAHRPADSRSSTTRPPRSMPRPRPASGPGCAR